MERDDRRLWCLVSPLTDDVERVPCTSGALVPRFLRARIDHPAVPYVILLRIAIEPDGSAVCDSFASTPRDKDGGEREWVHEVLANLPEMGLRQWVKYAVALAVEQEATGRTPLNLPPLPDPAGPSEAWALVGQTFVEQATRRRKATTTERLAEVARHYRVAVASGRADPTVAVGEAMHLSRSHAARLVGQARKQGLLKAARAGRGGEG